MFIDTHCHFDFPPFINDIEATLQNMQRSHVRYVIVPAVSVDRFSIIQTVIGTYPQLYGALGLHPIYHHQTNDIQQLEAALQHERTLKHKRIVAIGEIGLDNYVATPTLSEQLHFFNAQLELAKQYNYPVILHSRRAHNDLLKALKQAKLPCRGVIHGFSGSYEEAMQFIRLGYYIGVGGVISYERAKKTRVAISRLPLTSLLLETDAPDMPLSGFQGQPNRPEFIPRVFEHLIQIRKESADEIQKTIWSNTLTLFSIINTIQY